MKAATHFLNRLAGVFSSMALYGEGHPAREQAIEGAAEALQELLADDTQPSFSFLEEDVIYRDRPLEGMRNWTLGRHLARRGIERIEIDLGISRQEFRAFLEEAARQLSRPADALQAVPILYPHIRFGQIESGEEKPEQAPPFDLQVETGKVDWLYEEALMKGRVSATLARAVVQTLSTAMRYTRKVLVPLVDLKEVDQYSTVHSMNTSMLSMALGEYLRLGASQIRVIGEAALLHDMGKVAVPLDILNKPGAPSPEEWKVIRSHPQEGARILLRSGNDLDLAVIAAYEHHRRWDGGGYPEVHYKRRPHRLAQLIHICDTYDAMRTQRPHQGPLPQDKIISVLCKGAGSEYSPDLVSAFLRMLGQWKSHIVTVGEPVPRPRRPGE